MSNPLDQIHRDLARVADAATPVEFIGESRMRLHALRDAVTQACRDFDAAMVEHIQATGQDIVIGDVRYYAGTEKQTKCLSLAETVDAVLKAAGGDVGRFAECLSINGFKPGATREALAPDVFGRLFETTEKQELRLGKPAKRLLSVNEQFARAGRGGGK